MWTAILYDTDNNGYISDQEMNNAMNDWLAGKISNSQLQEVTNAWLNSVNLKEWAIQNIDYSFVSRYDTDSDGYISYQEFSTATSQYQTGAINYVQYAMVAAAYKYGINVKAEPKGIEIVYYDSMDWDTGINVGMIAVDSVASEFIISVGTPRLRIKAATRSKSYYGISRIASYRFQTPGTTITFTADRNYQVIAVLGFYGCFDVMHNGKKVKTYLCDALGEGRCIGYGGVFAIIENVKSGDTIQISIGYIGYKTSDVYLFEEGIGGNVSIVSNVNAFRSGRTSYQTWDDGSKVIDYKSNLTIPNGELIVADIDLSYDTYVYDAYWMTILKNKNVKLADIPNANYYVLGLSIVSRETTPTSVSIKYVIVNFSPYEVSAVPIELYDRNIGKVVGYIYAYPGYNTITMPPTADIYPRFYGTAVTLGGKEVDHPKKGIYGLSFEQRAYYTTDPSKISIPVNIDLKLKVNGTEVYPRSNIRVTVNTPTTFEAVLTNRDSVSHKLYVSLVMEGYRVLQSTTTTLNPGETKSVIFTETFTSPMENKLICVNATPIY